MKDDAILSNFFEDPDFGDDLLSLFDALEGGFGPKDPSFSTYDNDQEAEVECDDVTGCSSPKRKRARVDPEEEQETKLSGDQGQQRMSHITVERNRRKQMNEHLSVLRAFMPRFYVKRGDQASIIGGVIEYISELQQILQSLEAKKQRKVYSEVLSPRLVSTSPRPSLISPRKPPLSPRLGTLPLSPRTPQPSSPYMSRILPTPVELSPTSSTSSNVNDSFANELVANSKSAVAEVEVKFSGANLVLKIASQRIPGQVVKIISVLEDLSLEILQLDINTMDETMLHSFTIKIGIECQLSAEELAHQIQQTFCLPQ